MRSRLVVAVALVVVAVLTAGVASAAWLATGSGDGTARATTVAAPVLPSAATAPPSAVAVSWSAPGSSPAPVTGYLVTRVSPAGVVCTVPAATLTCTDTGRSAGTSFGYRVQARSGTNWLSTMTSTVSATAGPPAPTALTLRNNGSIAGRAQSGDEIEVVFSEPMKASTFCKDGWADDGADKSIGTSTNNQVVVTVQNGGAATDKVNVTAAASAGCTGGFKFGQIDLGVTNFVPGDVTFAGSGSNRSTIALDADAATLTVKLGGSNTSTGTTVSSTATYAPDAALRSAANNVALSGTAAYSGNLF